MSESAEPLSDIDEREREFGRYRLERELASGGMATVLLARVHGPGGFERPVAIKRIHPHLAKQPDFIEMFLDEARIAARIQHPNVCGVFDFGNIDGSYFMAMEYLHGHPLSQVLSAAAERADRIASPRWPALAARIAADVGEGLHAAHELTEPDGAPLGIVHRDVTPHNVFVTYDGAVKLVDFGIAWAHGRAHETRTGVVKGKFAYMAPEQLRGEPIDRKVDVWALGVCLWELLTLERLYGQASDAESVYAIAHEPIAPPSSVRPVPAALEAITMRALERDPARRYASARAMSRDLGAFVLSSGIATGLPELAELMEELLPRERAARTSLVVRREPARRSRSTPVPTAAKERSSDTLTAPAPTPRAKHPEPRSRWRPLAVVSLIVGSAILAIIIAISTHRDPQVAAPAPTPRRAIATPRANPVTATPTPTPPPVPALSNEPEAPPAIAPRPQGTGTLNVAVRGGWAEIYVDGQQAGTTPRSLVLPAGHHVVTLRSTGHAPIRRAVAIRRDRMTPLIVTLE